MSFELPALDRKATQTEVEAALEKYRIFKYVYYDEQEANITSSIDDIGGGKSNTISDQTGNIAMHNVDEKERRRRYCERIERAVKRLPKMERYLIEARYMSEESEYITDYNVYNFKFQPPISEKTYSKIRWKAFYKIALNLNIAVINPTDKGTPE
ncbi:ArpU family phage packaging/lysis transcriptional regulator [Oceanobacillus sp. J11TS1]|uniref:ArpU family phage packaging/lysis transcriptional regulator n=1 Tax=Oceanobacillus sp. J11TS1 TaxID=2807191 RepID=UPI001B2E53C1|nr:ArpU family phage packaging/lysis transcriptional regulator [Oceanobacillus sp. J11TS1]GIO22444.1 ArpU family transcriptional regulator [Oceanobacillus sp. J11TS1]